MTAVVDCGSPICILSDIVFKCITFNGALRKVESKVVGAKGSHLNILGTVELNIAFKGIRAKQLFYICDNLNQSALLGVDFLRENGCVVDFNEGTLCAGNTEVYLRIFCGLCSLIESIKQRTTSYHPQCDGGAERLIRMITGVIAKVAEEQEESDQYLPKVLLALRASTHETTGFSPSILMFGRELRLPIDTMREGPPSEQSPDYPSFVKRQQEILKGSVWTSRGKSASQPSSPERYDARCKGNAKPYQVGDLVSLEEKAVPRLVHWKFYRPWSGPWRVVKVISDITYRIQCKEVTPMQGRRKTRMVVHFNLLKPYLQRCPQLQPTLHDVERDAGQPTDLNVGERAVLGLLWACATDALPGGPAPTENAAAVNREPDPQSRHSTRDRRVPAWMGLSFRGGH